MAYEHFRRTADWPHAQELDHEFGDLLDTMGGLDLLTRQLGSDKVRPVSVASQNDFVVVTLKGLAELGEARDDLARFVDAVRFAAKRYRESRGKEATLRAEDLVGLPGFDAAAAKRAATLFGNAEVVSGGGGPDEWRLPHAIRRFADVKDPDDYFARVRAGFLAEARRRPERFRVIDATPPSEQVQEQLRREILLTTEAQRHREEKSEAEKE